MKQKQDDIEMFKFLWDGSEPGWTLFNLKLGKEEETDNYAIYNEITKINIVIEDYQLHKYVINKMKSMSVRVITSFNQS